MGDKQNINPINSSIGDVRGLVIAVLGLGEAGSCFANDLAEMGMEVIGFDPNPIRRLHPAITLAPSNFEASRDADIIFSVNLSSESENIAKEIAPVLKPHQFFCEMNTSSPEKKKAIATILKLSGVKMIDLAIMAPVPPKGIKTPFLAAGEYSAEFIEKVNPLNLTISGLENSQIGDAATRKLLRSIVYKGIAAVICEAVEAGENFEMQSYIREQISSVIGGNDELINRFVEGSKTHALRRMHEMEAVVEMLAVPLAPEGGAFDPIMSKATKESLRKLAKISNQKVSPLGVRGLSYMQIRGGSSKGLFFQAKDLPSDINLRNELIVKVMEGTLHGDPRQIDGLGGANPLTSKVAIVSLSTNPDWDLDYEFVQVVVGKGKVSTTQTCGNILAGVLPFAIESGMIKAKNSTTSARINIVNTRGICECVVQTPNEKVEYAGEIKIDGVVGTAAPIICNYLETAGATCGSILPTGNNIDIFEGIETTCIDNGMPLVIMRAKDFGLSGNESKQNLNANENLKKKIENIRLQAGFRMNLGDVSEQTIPKMCLISPAIHHGIINTRMFIPHVVHEAIGVLAAVSIATACIIPDSVCVGITVNPTSDIQNPTFSIEHPSGEFSVNLQYEFIDNQIVIHKSGVVRTARLLSKGEVFVPK